MTFPNKPAVALTLVLFVECSLASEWVQVSKASENADIIVGAKPLYYVHENSGSTHSIYYDKDSRKIIWRVSSQMGEESFYMILPEFVRMIDTLAIKEGQIYIGGTTTDDKWFVIALSSHGQILWTQYGSESDSSGIPSLIHFFKLDISDDPEVLHAIGEANESVIQLAFDKANGRYFNGLPGGSKRKLLSLNATNESENLGPYGPRENFDTFATAWGVVGGLTLITGAIFFFKNQWTNLKERVEKIIDDEKTRRAIEKKLFMDIHRFKPGNLFLNGPGSITILQPMQPRDSEDTNIGHQEKLIYQVLANEAKVRELFNAVTEGNEEKVISLITEHPELINESDGDGNTVLHYVAALGLPTLAPFLLQHGANPEILNNDGLSPLLIATKRDFTYLVELFIDWTLNISNEDVSSLFHLAVANRDGGSLLKALIRRRLHERLRFQGFNAWKRALNPFQEQLYNSQGENGSTLLHEAVITGNIDAVTIILDGNLVNINATDDIGNTALHFAVAATSGTDQEQESIVSILISHHIDINAQNVYGYTALHRASQRRQLSTISTLLDNEADPNIATEDGDTALVLACERMDSTQGKKEKEDIKDIIDKLAKETKAFVGRNKRTALHALAAMRASGEVIDNVCKINSHMSAHINAQDADGNTALHIAIKNKRLDAISKLVKQGATADIKNNNGETATTLAGKYGSSSYLDRQFNTYSNMAASP